MSGLFSSLSQSVLALNAQSRGVETAGRNLANVNNPDYSRQRVLFANRGSVLTHDGVESIGIEAKNIQQVRDNLLDRQLARELGLTAALEAEDSANSRAQAALGESIDRTASTDAPEVSAQGIAAALGDFFNAFQAFAARPTDLGEKQNLVQRADILAQRFNLTDARLAQIQTDLDVQIQAGAEDVNNLLANVAALNGQIGQLEVNAPGAAVDLRDQRQSRIEELAKSIGAETRANANNASQVDVFVRDSNGTPVVLVSAASVAASVAFDQVHMTATTPLGVPINLNLTGGSIKGDLTARDGLVSTLRQRLSDFAGQLASSVNSAYNPTGTGGNFFTVDPAKPAATITLATSINPTALQASAGGAAGDNTIAANIVNLATQRFSVAAGDKINGTFSQYYSGVVSEFGRTVAGTEGRLEDQKNIETLVKQQRQSVSGVSMDEEMADLLKFQRAFQASSKVISIIDGLLDTVVNGLVRG
ncbi:flagellar hook-associated protein FlgK [bacterium]|nr:flagellar hook-associated protein FlgK [bacterium]